MAALILGAFAAPWAQFELGAFAVILGAAGGVVAAGTWTRWLTKADRVWWLTAILPFALLCVVMGTIGLVVFGISLILRVAVGGKLWM
jgi:hypothetical protein